MFTLTNLAMIIFDTVKFYVNLDSLIMLQVAKLSDKLGHICKYSILSIPVKPYFNIY
jgi:hypothetical protein